MTIECAQRLQFRIYGKPTIPVKSTGIQKDHVESVDKVYVAAHLLTFGSWSCAVLPLLN